MFLTNLIGALGVAVSCGFTGLQPKRAGGALTITDGNTYTFTYRYSDMEDMNTFVQHTMTTDYSVYCYFSYVQYSTQSIVEDYVYVNVSSSQLNNYGFLPLLLNWEEELCSSNDYQVGFVQYFLRRRYSNTMDFYTALFSGHFYNGMYYFEGDNPIGYSQSSTWHPSDLNIYWDDEGIYFIDGAYPFDDDDFEITWDSFQYRYYSVSQSDLVYMGVNPHGAHIIPFSPLGSLCMENTALLTDFDSQDFNRSLQYKFSIYGVEGFDPQDYYDDGYRNGRHDGYQSGYDKGYDDGAETGAQVGYNNGYTAGVAASNDYTFLGLFGAVADTPVLVVRSLFNFDLFGVNLLTVVLSLFTALILFYLLRKLL